MTHVCLYSNSCISIHFTFNVPFCIGGGWTSSLGKTPSLPRKGAFIFFVFKKLKCNFLGQKKSEIYFFALKRSNMKSQNLPSHPSPFQQNCSPRYLKKYKLTEYSTLSYKIFTFSQFSYLDVVLSTSITPSLLTLLMGPTKCTTLLSQHYR